MTELLDDESLPTDREGLEAQIAEIDRRLDGNQEKIRELLAAEDPARGIFHAAEIHQCKQRSMMLRYQKDIRTVRLNALSPGAAPR